jgi:type I restriction enzyme R subunit
MKLTDTSEAGIETLICRALTGTDCTPRPAGAPAVVAETPAPYGGVGWLPGHPADYDREYCVDLVQLAAFLRSTQP